MSNNKMLYSLKIGTAITKIIPRRIVMLFTKYLVSLFSLIPTEMLKNIMNVQGIISPELNASELKLRARKVLNYYAQYWVDVFWISSNRSSKDISEIINVEGKNYYDNAVIKINEFNFIKLISSCESYLLNLNCRLFIYVLFWRKSRKYS